MKRSPSATARCLECGQRVNEPTPAGIKLGFLLFVAGVVAAIWVGDWRWAAMGVLALVLCAVFVGTPKPPKPGATLTNP